MKSTGLAMAALALLVACGSSDSPAEGTTGGASPPLSVFDAKETCGALAPVAFPTPLGTATTASVGTLKGHFAVDAYGSSTYAMPLTVSQGGGGLQPNLTIEYNSNGEDGLLGLGFSLLGLSSIARCPRNIAIDGYHDKVHYDPTDAYCMDGRRLIPVEDHGYYVRFRTLPDTMTTVDGYRDADMNMSSFDATTRDGTYMHFGESSDSNVAAARTGTNRINVDRAWLVTQIAAPSKNNSSIQINYLNFHNGVGATVEYEPNTISYAGKTISFVYQSDSDPRFYWSDGVRMQKTRLLQKIVEHGSDGSAFREYDFRYGRGLNSGRSLLLGLSECSKSTCKPETTFAWSAFSQSGATHVAPGFTEVVTNVPKPASPQATLLTMDLNADGLPELLTTDVNQLGGVTNDTLFNVALNKGGAGQFKTPSTVFDEQMIGNGDPPTIDNVNLEIGAAVDYNQDGRQDLFLYDVDGRFVNWQVLLNRTGAFGTMGFTQIDTGVQRHFTGAAPPNLVDADEAVHLADVDGDGATDLIACYNPTPGVNGGQVWEVHRWQASTGGFNPVGEQIAPLATVPCNLDAYTIDVDGDGAVDFLTPLILAESGGGQIVQYGTTYTAATLTRTGWIGTDTGLPLRADGGVVVFVDIDGNGLLDAVEDKREPNNFSVFLNKGGTFTGEIPALSPAPTIAFDGTNLSQAAALDVDGDGRRDLLLPSQLLSSPLPTWTVFHANATIDDANGAFTVQKSGIPADVTINGTGATITDPRAPRITDVDGDGDEDVVLVSGSTYHVFVNNLSNEDLLLSVTDGLNAHLQTDSGAVPDVSISYAHLIDQAITQGLDESSVAADALPYLSTRVESTDCQFPRRCVVGSRPIVRTYAINNGYDSQINYDVSYRDGRSDKSGPGFIGFAQRVIVNRATGHGVVDTYDNHNFTSGVYADAGRAVAHLEWSPALAGESNPARVYLSEENLLRQIRSSAGGASFFPATILRVQSRFEGNYSSSQAPSIQQWAEQALAGTYVTQLEKTIESFDYDAYDNNTAYEKDTSGIDDDLSITRTFDNDTTNWFIGDLRTENVCSAAGGTTQCRNRSRTYDPTTNLLKTEHLAITGGGDTSSDVSYDAYDGQGNLTQWTRTLSTGESRSYCLAFDTPGIHLISEMNPLGQATFYQYDQNLDVPLAVIDENALVTQWQYDAFGREVLEQRADSTTTTTLYTRGHDSTGYYTSEEKTVSGGADIAFQFDQDGRERAHFAQPPQPCQTTQCLIPPRIEVLTSYDPISGRVQKRSLPAAEGTAQSSLLYTAYAYDALGRTITQTSPWAGSEVDTVYTGDSYVSTEPNDVQRSAVYDAKHRLTSATDPGGRVTYAYGPFDSLVQVVAPGNVTTYMQSDAAGHSIVNSNPDHGTTQSVYNGFGELVSETDSNNRRRTLTYDRLGRLLRQADADGVKRWYWDLATNGVGKLATSTVAATEPGPLTSSFNYTYGPKGHVDTETLGLGSESFAVSFGYDSNRRITKITYPSATGIAPFVVRNKYDAYGNMLEIDDDTTGAAIWTLGGVDSEGRNTYEIFGNGDSTTRTYVDSKSRPQKITTSHGTSTLQDLTYKWDVRRNLSSRGDGVQAKTEYFQYDTDDRISCASFSSAFTACEPSVDYDPAGNIKDKSDVGAFHYDPSRPHAVATAGSSSFQYDNVGNQVVRPDAIISYTADDLPRLIISAPSGAETFVDYGTEDQKVRVTGPGATTVFLESLYERVTSGSQVVHRFKVSTPSGPVYLLSRQAGQADKSLYIHSDYLGSPEVLTNASGGVVEKRSYDAFGQRRNPAWGQPYTPPSSTFVTLGYTAQDDEVSGLVDMKGRTYDPKLGRFLQNDPAMSQPGLSEGWNPYAYVLQNPLRYSDPSGFEPTDDSSNDTVPVGPDGMLHVWVFGEPRQKLGTPDDQLNYSPKEQRTSNEPQAPPDTKPTGTDPPPPPKYVIVPLGGDILSREHPILDFSGANTNALDDVMRRVDRDYQEKQAAARQQKIDESFHEYTGLGGGAPEGYRVQGPDPECVDQATGMNAGDCMGAAGKEAGKQVILYVGGGIVAEYIVQGIVDARLAGYLGAFEEAYGGEEGVGFRTFEEFKETVGTKDGFQWHHVVGQNTANLTRFGPYAIHSTGNLVLLSRGEHALITAYFNSIQEFTEGARVYEWVGQFDYATQQQLGWDALQMLRNGGATIPAP